MAPAPPADPTFADWVERVREELGGRDPVESLTSRTVDGPAVRPLYVASDRPQTERPRPTGGGGHCRITVHPRGRTAAELNAAVLAGLGAGACALRLPAAALHDVQTLDAALAEVLLEAVSLGLESGAEGLPATAVTLAWLESRDTAPSAVEVDVGADPLAELAATGALPRLLERHLREAGLLARACDAQLPGWRALTASGVPYHEAGADDVQELGIVLATSVAYLAAMEDAGLPVERGCRQLGWALAQGRDLFLQIAKLRAARRLWLRLQAALEVREPSRLVLHAVGSRRTLTRYDRWVNILRATTQASAAILGGGDLITVQPFDAALGGPTRLAERLARNTVHVLELESALGAVQDAAGGSYYLESLTEELARGAWTEMRRIDGEGGVGASLASGALQRRIAERAAARRTAVASRAEPITGVSEYANLGEEPPGRGSDGGDERPGTAGAGATRPAGSGMLSGATGAHPEHRVEAGREGPGLEGATGPAEREEGVPRLDGDWLAAAAAAAGEGRALAELSGWLGGDGEGTRVEPLPRIRDAEPFEALRDAAAAAPEQPAMFLANLGPQRRHGGRSLFAANALAAGGVAAVPGGGTEEGDAPKAAASLVEGFRASGCGAACLCGDDELYRALGGPAVEALTEAGASPLWVAVPRGELAEELLAAGADDLLWAGCDLVERLRALHGALGGGE